jgi:hypothetical protein
LALFGSACHRWRRLPDQVVEKPPSFPIRAHALYCGCSCPRSL